MKRLLILILALTMLVLPLASCAKAPKPIDDPSLNTAETLAAYMKQVIAENPNANPETLAKLYLKHPYVSDMGLTVHTSDYPTEEPPYISGLNYDYTVAPYISVTDIAPQMWPNPYVSHLFLLDEKTDAKAYAKELLDNANLLFNVCMASDEAAVSYEGQYVFFVICASREDRRPDKPDQPDQPGTDEKIIPEAVIDSDLNTAENLVAYMKAVISANPGLSGDELAEIYLTHPFVKDMGYEYYTTEYPVGYSPFMMGLSDSFDIPKYKEETTIAPSFFPNKYVSHLILLEEGTDAEDYAKQIRENIDLGFNVCMISDEGDAGYEGRYVFFVICESRKEKISAVVPEVKDDPEKTNAENLVAYMKAVIAANPDASGEDLVRVFLTHPYMQKTNPDAYPYTKDYPASGEATLTGINRAYHIPAFESATEILPFFFPNKFVGGIIRVQEGTDTKEYADGLYDNINLMFNVCMASDEAAVGYEGNYAIYMISASQKIQ